MEFKVIQFCFSSESGREVSCGGKVNYKSEETATRSAQEMNAKPTTRNVLEPYPCEFCGGWHIGRILA